MQLVKELGSRSWINSSGRKDSKKFGLFLCPTCNKEVERPITKGKSANSCGDKECRKSTFRANPNNKGNTRELKFTDQIFYGTIKERYRFIRNQYKLCERWKTNRMFYNDMVDKYIEARNISDKIYFEVDSKDEEINSTNCRWVPRANYYDYPSSDNSSNRYLYIVKCGEYTKIGISMNIANRMVDLQTGNPFPISLIYAKIVENSYVIEKLIHNEYSEFNVSGEWFNITDDQIKNIILHINSL